MHAVTAGSALPRHSSSSSPSRSAPPPLSLQADPYFDTVALCDVARDRLSGTDAISSTLLSTSDNARGATATTMTTPLRITPFDPVSWREGGRKGEGEDDGKTEGVISYQVPHMHRLSPAPSPHRYTVFTESYRGSHSDEAASLLQSRFFERKMYDSRLTRSNLRNEITQRNVSPIQNFKYHA